VVAALGHPAADAAKADDAHGAAAQLAAAEAIADGIVAGTHGMVAQGDALGEGQHHAHGVLHHALHHGQGVFTT
jgi:hypothetical protein